MSTWFLDSELSTCYTYKKYIILVGLPLEVPHIKVGIKLHVFHDF